MMFQRIICTREDELDNGSMRLFAHITKSKLNPLKENVKRNFMAVKDGEVKFKSKHIFEGL